MEYEIVPADKIRPHPENARRGNLRAIRLSIETHGFYLPLVVQRSTGYILVGNHRYKAGLELGMTEFPVKYKDVNKREAKEILLMDNKSSDDASYDMEQLAELLESLDNDFEGTGFDADEVSNLLAEVRVPDFAPADQGETVRLDRRSITDCPKCGHTFTPATRSVTVEDDKG